ncbi:MAG: CopG family transcriptional regulator [Mobilitalea sp.]
MAKMGRPKSDEPKLKTVGVRLSEEDYIRLKEYALKHDMTMTEVMQEGMRKLLSKA